MISSYLFISYLLNGLLINVSGDPIEHELLEDLFYNYTPLERPVANHKDSLRVNLKLSIQQIIDIDEKNQIMKANGWMDMKWNNYRMTWNPELYDNLTKIRIPYDRIWVPDLLLYNSASEEFDPFIHTHITVDHQGGNLYVPPGIFESTCKIDVSNFPFDQQICKLKFGIWTYTGEMVDLQVEPSSGGTDITEYMENGEWMLLDVSATRHEVQYKCCPNTFIDITFYMTLERRSMFYVVNLVIPCILNSLLTLLTFILPAQAGEKITLSITVLLAQIVFMLLVMESMPSTSDAIPLISKYFSFSLFYVCASVGATVYVLSFHYCVPELFGPMSPKMRKIFLHLMPKLLHFKKYPNGEYLCVKDPTKRLKCLCNFDVTQDLFDDEKSATGSQSTTYRDIKMLQSLHRHLRYVAHKLSGDDKWEYSRLEWQFAASVLDRLALWFFTILVFVATLSTLFAIPSINKSFYFHGHSNLNP
ncbi:acetylcholine receptor subunit alpha-type acr-16-like [Styela clava]